MLSILVLTVLALTGFSGLAAAAPTPTPYPPGVTVINVFVTVNINLVIVNNGVIVFSGGGFLPGESIAITGVYAAPSGLRGPVVASARAADFSTTVVANSAGSFSTQWNPEQVGTLTLTATGLTSGRSGSQVVQVLPVGSVISGPAAQQAAAANQSAGTRAWGADAASGGGSNNGGLVAGSATGSGGSTTDLASTGANIAGPIAIGAAALLAGLALLLFGTRARVRRKNAASNI